MPHWFYEGIKAYFLNLFLKLIHFYIQDFTMSHNFSPTDFWDYLFIHFFYRFNKRNLKLFLLIFNDFTKASSFLPQFYFVKDHQYSFFLNFIFEASPFHEFLHLLQTIFHFYQDFTKAFPFHLQLLYFEIILWNCSQSHFFFLHPKLIWFIRCPRGITSLLIILDL